LELLLNLLWLLLALPACWLWRHGRTAPNERKFSCILALGCALVLLFPVISATDDLHAMRAEMEESAPNKRGVRPSDNEKGNFRTAHHVSAAVVFVPNLFQLDFAAWLDPDRSVLIFPAVASINRDSRAPPAFRLA
jgi:hypothetical protein